VPGISLRTLQDWEQGRRRPNQAAQSLLAVAAKRPDVMREVFGKNVFRISQNRPH